MAEPDYVTRRPNRKGSTRMTTTTPHGHDILAVPMGDNDARAATIRDYLIELLATLWREGETFSGRRPFGNSGWTDELDTALGRAGLVGATFDEDGCLEDVDRERADELIHAAIQALGTPRLGEGTGQTVCPTCRGRGTFTPVDGLPGERCPYCPHLYPAGRLATVEEIRAHLDECNGSSAEVVTSNAELDESEGE